MDRRAFLIEAARAGSVVLVLPMGWAAGGCGSGAPGQATGTTPTPANSLRFTCDISGIHTHDFLIAMDDFLTPPSRGVAGATTVTLGHKHTVALTEAELAAIEAGQTINKETSIIDGHQHNFKFSLSTAAQEGMTPATSSDGATSDSGTD